MSLGLSLKEDDHPPLHYPEMICDAPLAKKLDKINLTRNMNKCFSALIIGIPGSGKTSLLEAFLKTPAYFNKVFHKIHLFMPAGSRHSIKDSVFEHLPENQVYEKITIGDLQAIWEQSSTLAKKKKPEKSLIIFDDVQDQFGGEHNPIFHELLKMISKRRHAKLSFFILLQNYGKLNKKCRQLQTDLFLFNPSTADMGLIFEEHSKLPRKTAEEVINLYNTEVRKEDEKKERGEDHEKVFLYLNQPNQKVFINFQEFEFPDSAFLIENGGRSGVLGRKRKAAKEDDDEDDDRRTRVKQEKTD